MTCKIETLSRTPCFITNDSAGKHSPIKEQGNLNIFPLTKQLQQAEFYLRKVLVGKF